MTIMHRGETPRKERHEVVFEATEVLQVRHKVRQITLQDMR